MGWGKFPWGKKSAMRECTPKGYQTVSGDDGSEMEVN